MTEMSLEEFAQAHHLGDVWVELRHECNRLVERPDFWYRKEFRDSARELALKASDILAATIKGESRK